MAFQVIWTKTAILDLREIVRYISVDDSKAAERFGNLIIEKIERTAEFPYSSRVVPEKGDENIREIILIPYRIIIEVDSSGKVLYVLRIWHAARGLPNFVSD